MTPAKLIATPFTATSTTDDVIAGIRLDGLRAVVTGGSSGLGVETARSLSAAGANVVLAVRDRRAGEAVAANIASSTGRIPPTVRELDLANQASVARFLDDWNTPLHLLIANAGIVTGGLERTVEGWELQLATNHLGHFALTTGLRDALRHGADEQGEARVVVLSSTAHMRAGIDFDDLHFERRPYDPQIAYAQSKTANVLFAVEATRRWADDGVFANAVNPGGIATGLQRNFTAKQRASLDAAEAAGAFTYKTVAEGAATTLVAAVRPEFSRTGGHYLDDGQEAYTVGNDTNLVEHPHGVKQWALDPDIAQRLWLASEKQVTGRD